MISHLHIQARGEDGFTLIELLVVILIIGILAAVAIPLFLAQPGKAGDSNVESALMSLRTAESTYAISNGGTYTTSLSTLQAIEPSLTQPDSTYSVQFPAASNPSQTAGYTVTATSPKTGTVFTLAYVASSGVVTRSCNQAGVGVCSSSQTWGG